MTETILVTGAAGNIGSALVRKLLTYFGKYNVIGVDNLVTGCISKLPKESKFFKFINCDINDEISTKNLFLENKIDYVFHFAALVGVERTLNNPLMVLSDIDGFKNIFRCSSVHGIKKIVFSSSSEVYGEPISLPLKEELSPLNARLPYAIVKNVGEAFAKSYNEAYGLKYIICRFFNTYGPSQSDDFVVPKFIKKAIDNEPIIIYGDGLQTRTFCYVDDTVDTVYNAFIDENYNNQTINIGSDKELTINELANMVIKICNSSSVIIHDKPLERGDMNRRRPDTSKMRRLLNRDLIPVEDGIRKLKEIFKN